MKTKTATVLFSEIVLIKNTIEVPEDWTEEDISNDPEGILIVDSELISTERKTDSIRIL